MKLSTQKYYNTFFILIIAVLVLSISCKKNTIEIDGPILGLQFSNDSIVFDTVFTTIGSITKRLKVYNPYGHQINIESIELKGGESSAYRLNIDGSPAFKLNNIELEGKDSLYIFIKVLVDPSNENNPFVIDDEIEFKTTGKSQKVDLVAWGQNANYIIADKMIDGLPPFSIVAAENEEIIWDDSKPYLIYGYALVDSGAMLRIEAGTKIHFHNNSGLWVYKGASLKVMGTLEKPVIFEGDRMDEDYRDLPGQWDRILMNEGSVDNEINYAIIKNGFIGLQAETLGSPMGNRLLLKNTSISNMSGIGILSRNYQIEASNNVITNCGDFLISLTMGGKYSFVHTTFANYWDAAIRQNPSLYLNNYSIDEFGNTTTQSFDAFFGNCIIDGWETNELFFELIDKLDPKIFFDHSTLKTNLNITNDSRFNACLINPEHLFMDVYISDFRLDTLSPAIDKGSIEISKIAPFDILGNPRSSNPDLGAYEFLKDLPK